MPEQFERKEQSSGESEKGNTQAISGSVTGYLIRRLSSELLSWVRLDDVADVRSRRQTVVTLAKQGLPADSHRIERFGGKIGNLS